MTDEDIKKARERISKLMNMTVENGCTEDEAANAMRMAAGLAAKIGISLDSVRPKEQVIPKAILREINRGLKVYESYCAEAAAILYGVQCNAPNYGKHGFWFVGREENIELAEQTMLWLVRQVELLYKQHLPRGLSKRDRAEFRGSFKDACAERVYHRAHQMMREMKRDDRAAQEATGSNALVVAGYFETLKSEVETYWDDTYYKPARERAKRIADAETARIAAMPEPERVKYLAQKEKERLAAEKAAAKEKPYKAPRMRNPKRGSGTGIGYDAGNHVKLRQEIG